MLHIKYQFSKNYFAQSLKFPLAITQKPATLGPAAPGSAIAQGHFGPMQLLISSETTLYGKTNWLICLSKRSTVNPASQSMMLR
jgi:hypothetical protein